MSKNRFAKPKNDFVGSLEHYGEELAEEGQPFEVLAGVEEADDSDESQVITHEVLEDDVPSEYDRER
jgi:hypothetical protein